MRVLGIDPGLVGALAVLDTQDAAARWSVRDIPTIGEGKEREVDGFAIGNWLDDHEPIDRALIEYVGARPGEYLGAVFRFGMSYGALRALTRARGIPLRSVTPIVWKKAAGLDRDKEKSRLRAISLYPELASCLARKKDQNRAEAALIALHGAKHQRTVFHGYPELR